jgi:Holliday junction DNA helicase RuvA
MIARLRGEVLENTGGSVVVDCSGVGYEVWVPQGAATAMPVGSRVDLHVRQVVREDGVFLFGFIDRGQRQVFDLLRDVKGCGPKTSLSILSVLGQEGFSSAVAAQDPRPLTKAPGVGPRLAERIIVELKDKFFAQGQRAMGAQAPADDLVAALVALGYRRGEIEAVAAEAKAEAEGLEGQIKASLRRLAR